VSGHSFDVRARVYKCEEVYPKISPMYYELKKKKLHKIKI